MVGLDFLPVVPLYVQWNLVKVNCRGPAQKFMFYSKRSSKFMHMYTLYYMLIQNNPGGKLIEHILA